MIRILLFGSSGKMGRFVAETAARSSDCEVVAGIDKFPGNVDAAFPVYPSVFECREAADVLIDFSRPEGLPDVVAYARNQRLALIECTTGLTPDDRRLLQDASQDIPVFQAANMSLGVNLMMDLAAQSARLLGKAFDIEIIEKHHKEKVDAPSGTALALAEAINDAVPAPYDLLYGRQGAVGKRTQQEIGIHAVRGGTVPGEHQVHFLGSDEILTVTHQALSRQIFATGALAAARFMAGKPAGFYNMQDVLKSASASPVLQEGLALLTFTPAADALGQVLAQSPVAGALATALTPDALGRTQVTLLCTAAQVEGLMALLPVASVRPCCAVEVQAPAAAVAVALAQAGIAPLSAFALEGQVRVALPPECGAAAADALRDL